MQQISEGSADALYGYSSACPSYVWIVYTGGPKHTKCLYGCGGTPVFLLCGNAPASYDPIFDSLSFTVIHTEDAEAAKEAVSKKQADLVVLFPADFDDRLMQPAEDGSVPNIQVYYNYDSAASYTAYDLFLTATEELETSMVNVLDVNKDVENPDVSTGSSIILSIIPMLVVMLLFSSCASIAPESIAGEKERGTFATLLVTPISRTAIAIGKIISLSLFATLAGLSNFIGMMLGMRNMFAEEAGMLIPTYGATEYVLLLVLLVSAVLMTISIISVVSAFAKTVKEANSVVGLVTTVAAVSGLLPQFSFITSGMGWRIIPILGTAVSLNDIFTMNYSVGNVIAACLSNLVVTAVMLVTLSKMFASEKIMFNKA